jgi:hypothetical protein
LHFTCDDLRSAPNQASVARGSSNKWSSANAGQGHELEYFARKHGISRDQARDLIGRICNDRAKLNAAAAKLSGRQASSIKQAVV